jgi:hypothetical protein
MDRERGANPSTSDSVRLVVNAMTTKTALWIPAWHELDQPIAMGMRHRWWFFVRPPQTPRSEPAPDLVFFHNLTSGANSEVRQATILKIEHPVLGLLKRIDTDGLDYVFVRADHLMILVNAEEEPGTCRDPEIQVSDWSVRVDLADVSEPLADFS